MLPRLSAQQHVGWLFFPSFLPLVVLNMNPSALLEEICYYTENKPGFSYPSNNHSDGQVLGRGSGILGDGESWRVCIWLGCPFLNKHGTLKINCWIFQAVASFKFNLLPYRRG